MALESSVGPVKVAFFLIPRFSMMAFAAGIEPLRSANRLSGARLFEWQLRSVDGSPVEASNGIAVATQGSLADLGTADMVIVCAGLEAPEVERNIKVHHQLRRLARDYRCHKHRFLSPRRGGAALREALHGALGIPERVSRPLSAAPAHGGSLRYRPQRVHLLRGDGGARHNGTFRQAGRRQPARSGCRRAVYPSPRAYRG